MSELKKFNTTKDKEKVEEFVESRRNKEEVEDRKLEIEAREAVKSLTQDIENLKRRQGD